MSDLPLARSGRTTLEIAAQVAKEAGKILLDHFHSAKEIKLKGKSNIVTEVDLLCEKHILGFLSKEYPDFKILSEETSSTTKLAGYTWIIDPLDGTNNYAYGIPFFCVNVALAKDDEVLLGLTFDPLRGELFWVEKGKGAYLNDSPIHVSRAESLGEALLGFDLGYNIERGRELLDIIAKLYGQVHCVRLLGSASLGLAYVACGRVSIYIHRWLYPWDIAPGLLLIREAGGIVTDWQDKPANVQSTQLIASNPAIHRNFMKRFS